MKHNPTKQVPRTKVYFKPVVITIAKPFCPKCNNQIEEVSNSELKSLYTYICNHCGYKE